jgi:hypothetical protein
VLRIELRASERGRGRNAEGRSDSGGDNGAAQRTDNSQEVSE